MLDDNISHIENARKELREETGYDSREFIFLGESIIENNHEGRILYYLAKNCHNINEQSLEVTEHITVHTVSPEEFELMILRGEVLSSKTAFCFFLAQ